MSKLVSVASLLFFACFSSKLLAEASKPGEFLKSGMQLVYSSNGEQLPPWTIKTIITNQTYNGIHNCTNIGIAYEATEAPLLRWECIDRDVLNVDEGEGLMPSRPIAANMFLEKKSSAGNLEMTYQTTGWVLKNISGMHLKSLETTIYNYDEKGAIKSRLRELYSVELSTAIQGIFEIPDEVLEWKVANKFELVEISYSQDRL